MNIPNKLPWPGWRVVRRLGSGSYGSVFEIEREQFGIHERAALKVISFPKDPGELEEWRQSGYDDQTLAQSYRRQMERVLNEYKLLMELKGTSHIVNCDTYEVIAHPDGIGWDIYLRMELLTPLKSYLGNKITQRQVVALGADLCDALACCQQLDIIHRDIKPDNILVANNGDYKLGDFGIAKTTEKTMAGTRAGTPGFIAPEVYHNQPYGKSVDIYSLGMVLYWMLNRRVLPFLPLPPHMPSPDEMQEALLRRMRGEALPRPADGSRALQDVVLRACAYRPEDRYRTPEQLREALLAAARNASAESTDGSWSTPGDDPMSYTQTQGNNWETTGGCDDSDYTETFNTDPTMGTMGTEGGASASSGAKRQDAGTRGKDVYTLVRITPQEAAAGCKVETRDAAERAVRVAIPRGIENGGIVRLPGLGAAGVGGGAPGNLLVRVLIESAPAQDRPQSGGADEERSDERARGQDVYTLVHITPQEAAVGCKIETKDAAGRTVRVAIPQGVENGAVVRVNGLGAAGIGGGAPGDLLVRVYVQSAPAQKSAPASAARQKTNKKMPTAAWVVLLFVAVAFVVWLVSRDDDKSADVRPSPTPVATTNLCESLILDGLTKEAATEMVEAAGGKVEYEDSHYGTQRIGTVTRSYYSSSKNLMTLYINQGGFTDDVFEDRGIAITADVSELTLSVGETATVTLTGSGNLPDGWKFWVKWYPEISSNWGEGLDSRSAYCTITGEEPSEGYIRFYITNSGAETLDAATKYAYVDIYVVVQG